MDVHRSWLLSALLAAGSVLALQAADCTGASAWSATTTYAPGAKVTYAGSLYQAAVSTTNVPPNYCTTCGWWTSLGACNGTSSGGGSGSTGSGGSSGTCNYPNWVAGKSYNVGDIVKYSANGNYYKCTNANPGYDPTISTWFWSPYTCSGGGTATCSSAPTVPSGLYASNITTTSAQVNWSAVSTPTNCSVTYNVYKSGTLVVTVPTTSANITGLSAGSAYTFTVASVDAAGTSTQSATLTVTTLSNSGTCNYPNWVAGKSYNVGDIVKYSANGNYYKCTNANPGYDPTISTWFWSPYTCSGGSTGGGGNTGGSVQKPAEVPSDQWSYMVSAASTLGMPADYAWLLAAMDKQESAFGAGLAGSPSAGDGLMQVQPATRDAYSGEFSSTFGHAYNHGSYSDQIAMGGMILKDMINLCSGQYSCGLKKYNGGPNYVPGSVDAYGRPIYAEQYAAQVMSYYQAYGGTHP